MLLSLPILHHARVNPLLLQHNKLALFIHLSAYKSAEAVKFFLFSSCILILNLLQPFYSGLVCEHVFVCSAFQPACTLLPVIQINKRRDVV